jgi:signal transduction histidine kinase
MSSPSAFISRVSASELRHLLRTPLNHIIGYAEFLVEEYPDAACTRNLAEVLEEAKAILESVQQMTGSVRTTVPDDAVARLRNRLDAGARRVLGIVRELQELMPPVALGDLGRIASAANSLAEAFEKATIDRVMIRSSADPEQPSPLKAPAPQTNDNPGEAHREGSPGLGRILVVDDDEINRDMLRRQLSRQQLEVMTAPNGAAALAMLREQHFEILLLDLMMDGMNGFEVLEIIKSDPALSGVAVIMVSALDEMDSVVRAIEAGAEDYLFKPVNPTLLRARIKSTLDKLRAEETVRRKQRLESIGLLAAGIAHDFNNLLTGIIGYGQLLRQALTAPGDRDMADAIIRGGERGADLTRQLLAYSGKGTMRMQTVNLASLIRESEGLIQGSLTKNVRLEMHLGHVPAITADVNQIRRVLVNLTLNAAEAIGPDEAGSVAIETGTEKVAAGTQFDVFPDEPHGGLYAWFELRDSGCGMDAATLSKIFEPFFTTKFLGRGLGLAAVAGIVRSHNGLVRARSAPGEGTTLRIYFPVAADEEIAERIGEKDAASTAGLLTLVVEEEPEVRRILKVSLERAGRGVVLAQSGDEAMEALRRLERRIDSVLLDWDTTVMDSHEIVMRLRHLRPDVKVIISGVLSRADAEERFRPAGVSEYLQKPYRMSELLTLLEPVSPAVDSPKQV